MEEPSVGANADLRVRFRQQEVPARLSRRALSPADDIADRRARLE